MDDVLQTIEEQLADLMSRVKLLRETADLADDVMIRRGQLGIDIFAHRVFWKGKEVRRFTRREFEIVLYLATHPDVVRTRRQIMDYASFAEDSFDRNVDSMVKRVRNKFKRVDPDFSKIETVTGVGYKWLS